MSTPELRLYNRDKMRRWRAENHDHWLAYMRVYKKELRARDPETARAQDRARYARDKEHIKDRLARYRAARAAFVSALKDKPCADCGQTFHPAAMQFDHLPERGPKRFNISHATARVPIALILEEVALCEVVCANCHAMRTYNRQVRR